MPPDESDLMRDAQFKFERAMSKITKATSGVRRDLPIEIDMSVVKSAESGWEEGRFVNTVIIRYAKILPQAEEE